MIVELVPLAALPLVALLGPFPTPLEAERDVATLFPAYTLAYVEAPGLAPLAARGLEHPLVRAVLDSELGRAALAQSEKTPEELLAVGAAELGRDPLAALASLTRQGVALGLAPKRGGVAWCLVALGDDAALVDELLARASAAVERDHGVAGLFDEPQRTLHGADLWTVEDVVLAHRGALVALASDERYLDGVLALAAGTQARSLAERESFAGARARRSSGATAWAFVDRARSGTLARAAGGAGPFAALGALESRPKVQYLLGPGIAALGGADTYAAELRVTGGGIALELAGDGASAASPVQPSGTPATLALPAPSDDDVATALLYRDFAGLHAHRAELFEPEIAPRIAQKTSELALLFGGSDVGEELLPRLSPWMRLVARRVPFDAAAEPDVALPAVALLVDVDEPERTGSELERAFQTAIGIANVQRAQDGEPALLLDLELVGGLRMTSARLPEPMAGEGVDIAYNLRPACALVGRTFVIGTHDALVRSLVRELAAGAAVTRAPGAEHVELAGPGLARYVARNLELLTMQKVLEEGLTPEEARAEIEGLRMLLALVGTARIELRYAAEERIELSVALELAAPKKREVREL